MRACVYACVRAKRTNKKVLICKVFKKEIKRKIIKKKGITLVIPQKERKKEKKEKCLADW